MTDAIKKVAVRQLRPGMYIHDLNCGWMDHPFLANSFKIKDIETIQRISTMGIQEVYIDTGKGDDVSAAMTREEVLADLQRRLQRVSAEASPGEAPPVSVREERINAERVEREASRLVTNIMQDVRLGKQIEVERVTHVVDGMVSSIFRNPHALMSLGRIRQMDKYTFEHSVSVGVLMLSFAKELGLERDVIHEIGIGALLHDIGKIKTPDKILNKPGKLTDDEFAIMRQHVVFSREVLEQTAGISPTSLAVAAQHHERYDGTGYPLKLKGDEISPYGQMAAIVDVYDAISADRCYRKGEEPTIVLRKLLEWSKFHFNEKLVHQFIRCVGIYPVGTLVRLESGRLAIVLEPGEKGPLYPTVRVVYDTNKRQFVTPRDIDLSNPTTRSGDDRIVNCESAEKYGIKIPVFMDLP
ncbi:MAG: HD-GYP domain-containing protein [Thiohalomonadaceae bacterium]